MENVLIVSSSKTALQSLASFFKENFSCVPKAAESAYQAEGFLEKDPSLELVVINSPLMDDTGIELAEHIVSDTLSCCILMIKRENAEKFSERAEKSGIIVIGKPFGRDLIYQLVRTVDISLKRSQKLYLETIRLENKITEIKTIDKAKFMLMQYKEMTEAQAHSYLEQYAMNKRRKKNIAALEIIDKINEQYL
ncbi:MAG: ANTAR domain-containing protein [Ruminococcus sp.]|nr:ANTAR domain-containing protein [Ruminococcus sp.]